MTKQEGVLPHAHHPQPGWLELIPGNEKQWSRPGWTTIIKDIFLGIKTWPTVELRSGRAHVSKGH